MTRLDKVLHLIRTRFDGNQAEFARAIKRSPSQVHHWIAGIKNVGDGTARNIEVSLQLPAGWFDLPHLQSEFEKQYTTLNLDRARQTEHIKPVSRLKNSQPDNLITLPILSAVGSMGNGESLFYDADQVIDGITVNTQWVSSELRAKPENLRIVTGAGDSMSPTFEHGDLLLVDVSHKRVNIDGVYAMSANDRLYIKRVRQKITGEFEISSDNPTVKTVDVLNGSSQITILGRIIYSWKGKKL